MSSIRVTPPVSWHRGSAEPAGTIGHGFAAPARAATRSAGIVAVVARLLLGQTSELRVDVIALGIEEIDETTTHGDVLTERHRTFLRDDDAHVTAHLVEPFAELLGIGHRCRQGNQTHRRVQAKNDLLPHRAAEPVRQVVHLVHDDPSQPDEGR